MEFTIYSKNDLDKMKKEIAKELQILYRIFPQKYSESDTMKFINNALIKLTEEYNGTADQYVDFLALCYLLIALEGAIMDNDEMIEGNILSD